MRILSLVLKLIGGIIYLFLPIILFTSIISIYSKDIAPGINPIIRYIICTVLLLIMIGFSLFCTIKRNSVGETKKIKGIFRQPKIILGLSFVVTIFITLMIQQNISAKYVVLSIIGFILICLLAYKYMRNSMDYESEYLIGLWIMVAFAIYIIIFA